MTFSAYKSHSYGWGLEASALASALKFTSPNQRFGGQGWSLDILKGIATLEIQGIQGQEGWAGVGKVVEQRDISGGTGWADGGEA